MAERRTPIQVPPRQEDEAPASPEQLQFIRQLVTGMSMSGFRFDYRKLGTEQAASVIDQLLQLRETSGIPTRPKSGGGCIGSLVRGTVRATVSLIVLVVVVAGVALGGYLIYEKINEPPTGNAEQDPASNDGGTEDGASGSGGKTRELDFFGHKIQVEDDDQSDPDDPGDPDLWPDKHSGQPPKPRETTPTPTDPPTTTVTPPKASFNAQAIEQLADLELMLAQLKTFTRKDSQQRYRAESVKWMQKNLTGLSAVMDAIASADPALAQRVRSVIAGYAADEIDGEAIRNEIDAIREQLKALAEGS